MPDELINLLPRERRRALVRDYRLRLGVVVAWLFTALACAAALLLLPTYLLLTGNISAKEIRLANVESTLSAVDEAGVSARLAALGSAATTLIALGDTPSASAAIAAALAVPRPGIVLSNFGYVPAAALTLSGRAATRDTLRAYQLALQSAPFARSAALPVSAYAQDTNIAFTITVTLAP